MPDSALNRLKPNFSLALRWHFSVVAASGELNNFACNKMFDIPNSSEYYIDPDFEPSK